MSHARPGRRVLAVTACMVVLSLGAGCRPSSFQRLVEAKGRPKLTTSHEREAVPELAPVVAPIPVAKTVKAPPVVENPVEASPSSDAVAEAVSPMEEELIASVEPTPTPLLDAALRRAEALEESQRREIADWERATAAQVETPKIEPAPFLGSVPEESPAPLAPAPVLAPSPKVDEEVVPADASSNDEADLDALRQAYEAYTPAIEEEDAFESSAAVDLLDLQSTAEGEAEAPIQTPSLVIQSAQLCRKIEAFGSVEPLNARTLRPGKSVLVYCELAGLEYHEDDGAFIANVDTRIELIRTTDGVAVWDVSQQAEDRCDAKRRDTYVGVRITFPEDLEPGEYTLRILQADATTDQTAAADLSVTIAR